MYTYDTAGRLKQTNYPDSTQSTSAFASNWETFTDAAGRVHKKYSDDLGHLTSVIEDPAG